jgi:1-aminocyclopropane-1-carboxylate deaminase
MISLDFHSPEEELQHPLFAEKQVRVFIKRDDLIHPYISGNKWRKLKYLLRRAEVEQKPHLVTFGGVWSNHLLATACAAAKFGFSSTGIVRGEAVNSETLMLCRLFGMELIYVDRESYRDKPALFKVFFEDNPLAFFINEGGASTEAAQGCEEIVDELQHCYDHIFCACGTGTTAAGIINGLSKKNLNTNFGAISALKGDFLRDKIQSYLKRPRSFDFYSNYSFGGYAKTQPELISFIENFSAQTGILLDPVYTGKMMFAIFHLIEKGHFSAGAKILAIHTGGLLGLFGMKDLFKK